MARRFGKFHVRVVSTVTNDTLCWRAGRDVGILVIIVTAVTLATPSLMPFGNDTTTTEFGALGGVTECLSIWALAAENGGFVVIPVTLTPDETTIFGQ